MSDQQPPSGSPSQPGSQPFNQPPQQPPPYGTPPTPYGTPPTPYGTPPTPYGTPPNPYGTPPNPYGTPPAGQGGYQPYPGGHGSPPPTGMGAGKIVAIVAAVVGGLVVLAIVAVVAIVVLAGSTGVDDLAKGDCVTAEGLSDSESDEVTQIEVVGCGEPHDGEVLATKELSKRDAEEFNASTAGSDHCAELVETALPEGVRGTALTQAAEPASGDLLVCIVFSENGDELTEKIG